MQNLIADNTGAILAEFPITPGREYSLYVAKHPGEPPINTPAAGSLNVYQSDEPTFHLAFLDHEGQAVTADLSIAQGIAITFIAHCTRFHLVAQGLTEEDGLKFSLLAMP